MYRLLDRKQKLAFLLTLLIMAVSSVLTQFTPKAIGWLTDDILRQAELHFQNIIPVLVLILIVTVTNELLKIARRLMVEDTATKTEKKARQLVIASLLKAPLSFFKENMTGNIHGRLNRCLDGTIKLEKLFFMDFAPAIFNSIAAIIVIFMTLPVILAVPMLLVVPIGIGVVLRQISTQRGIRVELLDTKSAMDGSIVELLNGIEVIRITDSVSSECRRFETKSETLRTKEMKHHVQMAEIPHDFSYETAFSTAVGRPFTDSGNIIKIRGLHFTYDANSSVLHNLDLSIKRGMFLGIAGTIRDNICYGLEYVPAEHELREAVRKSCLNDFIASLPNGLDTYIAEGGGNLSGGQKQRIAIARIFLRKPQILILDEATSALDNTSERLIQNEIEELIKEHNMTVLSIAHRLTTLQNASRIIVMDKGNIAEQGTFEELLLQKGIFSDMYHGKLK